MDYYNKLFKYRTAGVREYWIVDHERSLVTVYNFQNDSAANYAFRIVYVLLDTIRQIITDMYKPALLH